MRAAGLSRLVPPPYMQPSFAGYHRKGSGTDEESEDFGLDIVVDEHQDSSVEYDYDLSEDEHSDEEAASTAYPRRQR